MARFAAHPVGGIEGPRALGFGNTQRVAAQALRRAIGFVDFQNTRHARGRGISKYGKSVRVLIGLLDVATTLDSKGKSANKSFTLKTKKGSSSAKFTFAMKNQDLFAKLHPLGFSKTQSTPALPMPVIVVLGDKSYLDQPLNAPPGRLILARGFSAAVASGP